MPGVQPVSSHSSSSISPFSFLVPRTYRLAICLVTALRCAIDRPTATLPRATQALEQGERYEDILR